MDKMALYIQSLTRDFGWVQAVDGLSSDFPAFTRQQQANELNAWRNQYE